MPFHHTGHCTTRTLWVEKESVQQLKEGVLTEAYLLTRELARTWLPQYGLSFRIKSLWRYCSQNLQINYYLISR